MAPLPISAPKLNYLDSMRPSITKAMEDIDDEIRCLFEQVEEDEDHTSILQNGGKVKKEKANAPSILNKEIKSSPN